MVDKKKIRRKIVDYLLGDKKQVEKRKIYKKKVCNSLASLCGIAREKERASEGEREREQTAEWERDKGRYKRGVVGKRSEKGRFGKPIFQRK